MFQKRKIGAALLAMSFFVTQIITAPVFAAGEDISRIAGEDRYKTAVAISQQGWETSEYAVLARGDAYADALTAGPLAAKYNAPILLTAPKQISNETLAELKRLGVKQLLIAGGTGAVSQNIENTLKGEGMTVERIFGADRYETAAKLAEKVGNKGEVVLATGHDYPDALSISVVAAKLGMPILLTSKDSMPKSVSDYFKGNSIAQTYIVGGTGVIGTKVENSVPGPVRLAGKDRYQTNVEILKSFAGEFNFDKIYIALGGGPKGNEFADALTGAVLAAKTASPLVLVGGTLPKETAEYLKTVAKESTKVIGLGGKGALASTVLDDVIAVAKAAGKADSPGSSGGNTGGGTGGGSGGGGGGGGSSTQTVGAVTIATDPADVSGLTHDAGAVKVTLSTSTNGAQIYYTTDGTTPTSSATKYTEPFEIANVKGMDGGSYTVKAIGIKSGMYNSKIAEKTIVYSPANSMTVNNAAALKTALESNVATITLSGDINGDVTAIRAGSQNLTVDFGIFAITGDLNITADNVTSLTLEGTAVPAIKGNLTVSAAKATVTNQINVSGTITVKDVGTHSWQEEADDNTLIMADPNGASLLITGNPKGIEVAAGVNDLNIEAKSPVSITVASGARVSSITAAAPGTIIANDGTIASVIAEADITIVNNSGTINVSGTGTVGVSGDAKDEVKAAGEVKSVKNITALGIDPAELRMGGVTTASIINVTTGAAISYHVTSANEDVVKVDNPAELRITAQAPGRTAIIVQVKEAGEVIEQGTLFVTVLPAESAVVKGTIARDPGNTGGEELGVTVKDDKVSFTSGKIKWYPADENIGRAEGNRVGVQITAPAGFNTDDVKVRISDTTYEWEKIKDGDNFFWWYPLVTVAGQEFTATVAWNESSTQVFTVVIGESVTLEKALEAKAPSIYKFSYELTDKRFVANSAEGTVVPVTIEPEAVKELGYDSVRFEVEVSGPEGAKAQLLAKDSNGVEWDVADIGYWGPETGFSIAKDYNATTDFTAKFDTQGIYTITFKLVDLSNSTTIVENTVEIQVDSAEPVEPTPIQGTFESTGNVGIAPDTAGEAAGKIYAEYKLVAEDQDISLAQGNIKYIKVKAGEEEWEELTPNTDTTLWFNVEADQGELHYEVKTNDDQVYTATLDWQEVIKTAAWGATGREGTRPGTEDTYVEYKMMDEDDQVSLREGEVKLIASKDDVGKWRALEPNTDTTLWFNKAKASGEYDFFVVTKNGAMYKATLDWTSPQPTEAAVKEAPGVSPEANATIEGVQEFTFGFQSVTGSLQELELDIYLGDNTDDNRDYTDHLGINLLAGSGAVASWVDQLVESYGQLDSKFHGLLAAVGYKIDADENANKAALKGNIFYTGDGEAGVWTIRLDTAVLNEENIEFLVAVRDDQGAQWGNNNYIAYPNDVKAFLYNVTLSPEAPSIPELTAAGPAEAVANGAENFAVTFAVKHDKALAFLEIDHNLGKHGSLPAEVGELPEFKLYPNAGNPWATSDTEEEEAASMKEAAEEWGVSAEYDADTMTWGLTFAGEALEQIRKLTQKHTQNEFKIYSLVQDLEGTQSGSMYDGSYVTTVVTFEEADPTIAEVKDLDGLTTALADDGIETINIKSNITSEVPVLVKREVIINGGGHTLSFTGLEDIGVLVAEDDGLIIFAEATVNNLTVDAGLDVPSTWVGTYAIHVYNTKATLNNVKAIGGNGGILVNGSEVILTGDIDVSGNGYGGIEVSVGTDLSGDRLALNVTGADFINESEAYGKPTIWEDNVTNKVNASDGQFKVKKISNGKQYYYLDANKATETDVKDLDELLKALENEDIATINIKSDITSNKPVLIKRTVKINGGGYKLSFSGLEALEESIKEDDGLIIFNEAIIENLTVNAGLRDTTDWKGTYAIHVYNTNATLSNVTATGGNGGILVNGSNVTLTGDIDVSGNRYGGIEVSVGEDLTDAAASLDVTTATLSNESEAYGKPTIWIDGENGGEVVANPSQFTTNDKVKDKQVQYYITSENAEES